MKKLNVQIKMKYNMTLLQKIYCHYLVQGMLFNIRFWCRIQSKKDCCLHKVEPLLTVNSSSTKNIKQNLPSVATLDSGNQWRLRRTKVP
jgi:hypothetical protein